MLNSNLIILLTTMYINNVYTVDVIFSCWYQMINFLTFAVPDSSNVTVTASVVQIVGQSLMLECRVTTVRGITSRIDIEWTTDNTILQKTEGVNITFTTNDSIVYKDIYIITQVSTFDDGRVYQCEMIINTNPQMMATDTITLDVTGK